MSRSALLPLLALSLLAAACVDPQDRRPGLWLRGEVVEEPVSDWSFSDAHREIFVQTSSGYGIPHSVTVGCASLDGSLYLSARHPRGKRWVANVARDPDVRLGIGGRLYDRRLEPVEEPARIEAIYRAYLRKYGAKPTPPAERPPIRYWRVVERL